MPKIINNLDARSEITEIKALNDQIVAFSTRSHGIKLFAVHESELKLSLITKHLNAQTKAIALAMTVVSLRLQMRPIFSLSTCQQMRL